MKQVKTYFLNNRLMRSLIKLPLVLTIWATYAACLLKGNFPLFVYFALLLTAGHVIFTFNLKEGIVKLLEKGGDFRSHLSFYPPVRSIFSFLLMWVLLFIAMEIWMDHDSRQKSFEVSLHMWIPIMLFFMMKDAESWLIYKHGLS